ncbi:MAG: hypothetical protein DWC06_01010 [Candidatus Poseidoniales archaeon]|nr:MAG: hypothetical protein DWC06_01010 [Candidatus Poseidoniales archaeon]
MSVKSDDGFWELSDGKWIPTDKQKSVIANSGGIKPPSIPGKINTDQHTKFVPKVTQVTNNEVSTNLTGNEGYIQLGSLTTTKTHTAAAKAYLGNPFYQGFNSRIQFNRIQDPGAEKLRKKLLRIHDLVENTARSKFISGDMSHNAEQIIQKMYYPNEKLQHDMPLKIRRVEVFAPSENSPTGFKMLSGDEHHGVRGLLTTERMLLIDSTEDAVTELTNPKKEYQKQFLQRKSYGIYEISHKIMHDFWYKSIPLEDISGTEFHFSHYSNSSKVVRRFHHYLSLIMLFLSLGVFLMIPIFEEDLTDDDIGTLLICGFILLVISGLIYYFASLFKQTITISDFGKKRNLKIGYFDRLHKKHLVLNLTLEDSQTIEDTVDWIKVLDNEFETNND